MGYVRILEIRGGHSAPRITYVEGTLEIMSPSRTHDEIKSYIGRLVEAWCLERGVEFTPYVYRKLGAREVWYREDGRTQVHVRAAARMNR